MTVVVVLQRQVINGLDHEGVLISSGRVGLFKPLRRDAAP